MVAGVASWNIAVPRAVGFLWHKIYFRCIFWAVFSYELVDDRIAMNEPPNREVAVFAAVWELPPPDKRGAYLSGQELLARLYCGRCVR
jgi:hypothetical protein